MIVRRFGHNKQKKPDGKEQNWDPRHDFGTRDLNLREFGLSVTDQSQYISTAGRRLEQVRKVGYGKSVVGVKAI